MKTTVDIRLERDPRYVAAQNRYTQLQQELSALEGDRDRALAGLNSIGTVAQDRITEEAQALLSGEQLQTTSNRDTLLKTYSELMHKMRVLREAISMQKSIVQSLAAEIGNEIATTLLPQHMANVAAVAKAALQLSSAIEAEADLRNELIAKGIPFTAVLRPMVFTGVGLVGDSQSRLVRYLLECEEYGFVQASALPDVVRRHILPKAKHAAPQALRRTNVDGWLHA